MNMQSPVEEFVLRDPLCPFSDQNHFPSHRLALRDNMTQENCQFHNKIFLNKILFPDSTISIHPRCNGDRVGV